MRYFLVLILILLAFISFDTPQPARAGVITVDGTCTLVDAIIAANTDAPSGNCPAGSGPDVITLDVDVTIATPYQDFIGLPEIVSDITIQAGAGNTISGNGTDILLFYLGNPASRLTIDGLTIENSRFISLYFEELEFHVPAMGGAISINDASAQMFINNSTLRNNAAIGLNGPDGIGGDAYGGAVYNRGYLEITNSIFQNNSAIGGDSDQYEPGGYVLGGAIANENVMMIESSTFEGNIAEGGNSELLPAGVGGAIFASGVESTVVDSVFSNNTATARSQSPIVGGGAIYVYNSDLTVDQSLFSDNSAIQSVSFAGLGGAIRFDITDPSTATITNSTFYQNNADVGGAIFTENSLASNAINFSFNTLVENTSVLDGDVIVSSEEQGISFLGNIITSPGGDADCYGLTAANGSNNLNLAGDTSCDVISSGNIIPGTHFSTALTDEGLGVPAFLPLLNVAGNPAVNAVASCGLTEDQRGLPRDANCDVGSYELQEPPIPTDTPVPPTDTAVPPTDTAVPPSDTPGPTTLAAFAACNGPNLEITISAGDGPFDITASAGMNTPVNAVGIGTTSIAGPEKWDNLTVIETSSDFESINLGQFKCRTDERPVPLLPAHRARITDPTPTFSWAGISNANNYRVFIFDDKVVANRTVDIRQNSGGPTYLTLNTPLPDGRLFWRVRGRQNRVWSLWSVRFTLFKDPAPQLTAPTLVPTIELSSPPTVMPQPTWDTPAPMTLPPPPNSR